jgi:hypothetical protein
MWVLEVAINAKGGECWKIFNRQCMLVYLSLMESTAMKMA